MKKTHIVIGILASLFLVAIIIVALLPGMVSSNMMKPFVLQQINQRVPGQLQLEAWSLGWFSGIEGKGIIYDNRQDDLLVKVAGLKTSKGLFGLITKMDNLGTVEITDPAVYVHLAEKTADQKPDRPAPEPQPKGIPEETGKAALPAFYGQLLISGGSIYTVQESQGEKTVAKDLNLVLDASGPKNPLTYRFSTDSGDKSGRASGEGTLAFSPDDPLNIEKIQADAKLVVENWELEDILAIVASRAGIPLGKGRLNAQLSFTGKPSERLHLLSRIAIDELKMWGGPLGKDTPVLKGVSIDFDATQSNDMLSLDNLGFRSSFADGSAKGRLDSRGQRQFTGNAKINLVEVFSQLPSTLQLREGTRLSQGKIDLSANVETSQDVTSFDAKASIDQLQGISNGKKLSWDKPVTIDARGEKRSEGLKLENLSLKSAFLNATGQGDLSNMQVDLSADLQAALKELRKFIQIKEWDGGGKLNLNLAFNEKAKNLRTAKLNVDVNDFVLNRNNRSILPKQNVHADINTDVTPSSTFTSSTFSRPVVNIQSTLASIKFTAAQLALNSANGLPNETDLDLDGNVNLQQLTSLLQNLKILTPNTQLEGQSNIRSSGSMNEGKLELKKTTVDTEKFVYRQDEKTIREDRLTLTTKGNVNFNAKSIYLAPIDINGQAGTIRIPELKIADWSNAQNDMKTQATANLDLAKLTSSYGDFIALPPKTSVSGKGTFNFDMDFSDPKTQYLKLQGNMAPFEMASETLPSISEKNVKINADVKRSPDGKHMTIEKIQVDSNALALDADGKMDQMGKKQVLEAQGTMGLDMALVSDFLKKTGRPPVELSGGEKRPFRIKLVSTEDGWQDPLKHLEFSGALHVNSVTAYGLKLTPNDVPIRVANAAGDAALNSPANGGQLSLQPIITMGKEPYVLSFTKNSDILKDVQVTQGLIDGLLANIHPLFKNAVIPDGIIDLHMKNFSLPLSEKGINSASFAGTLGLNGIKLNSTPFLSGLLSMMKINERELLLNDQSIDFTAKNGRVECSQITIDAGGYPLTMQGSIGFDKTLDFIAGVPVTKQMVGKDAYQYLQGTTIKVPISGTVSKPKVDQTAFQSATGDLMQQALQKNVQKGVEGLLQNLLKKNK
jgi:translocation and assembly module TamB